MAIVFRNTKGSALTHAELDGNFTDLDNRISTRQDSSTIISLINNNETLDSAKAISIITATVNTGYVQARQIDLQRDSAFITNIVDSAYVLVRAPAQDFLDSSEAIALVDSSYVQARQITYTNADFADSAYVTSQINSVIDVAPGALNTLNELAAAIGDDANFSTTITNSIATKLTSAQATNLVDSSYVQARQINNPSGVDSSATIALIDSAYVQARQTSGGSIDSAATIALIDSDYIQIRQITVGGSNTQVQFNDGGSFAGDAGLVYSKDSDLLTAVNLIATNITTTGAGSTTVTAGANIELNATNRVLVTDTPFRLASLTTTQRNAISSPVDGDTIYNSTIGQFDIYQRSAWQPLTKGSAIFNVVNNGSSDYAFTDAETHWFPTSTNDPVLYLRRGETYYFVVNASGHPFQIRASNGGSAYTTGVTNNGAAVGTVVFKVPMAAPATLYYQCTNHSGMGNTINIV